MPGDIPMARRIRADSPAGPDRLTRSKGFGALHRLALLAPLALAGCASGLMIYADDVPPGTLRVAQVQSVATRNDIVQMQKTYQALLASGIKDSAITNGSLGAARVLCCGGPAEHGTDVYFYIPPDTKLAFGDFVEIRSGKPAKDGSAGVPSSFVRVVQKRDERTPQCRWDPPEEYNWKRVVYCDWMPKEGWIEPGLFPVWYKR